MKRLFRVLREPLDEEFHECVDVLASDGAVVDRGIAIAIADIDGLVQKNHI
jgi:hypothetical protein